LEKFAQTSQLTVHVIVWDYVISGLICTFFYHLLVFSG